VKPSLSVCGIGWLLSLCSFVVRCLLISDSIIGSPNQEAPRIQRCLSGGLLDGGASIVVDGMHIANWLIGQVLDEDYDMEDLVSYADVIGIKRDVYRKLPKYLLKSIS